MTQELLYTSAPKGLKPGSRGFCTVVSTQGMAAPLASALESLSGYRPVFPHGDARSTENPVVFAHTKLTTGGRTYSVLSRTADYGLDYSQRTNKLAHHVVLDPAERPAGGPAWALGQPGLMQTEWDGEPRILPTGRTIRPGDQPASICQTWRDMTGDAGWAGVLAEAFLSHPDRLAYLIFEPGMDLLPLLQEAIALLPAEHRWDVTFSTYFTNLPPGATCNWRCVLNGSPEAHQSRRFVQALRINLCEEMGIADGGPLIETARTGKLPPQHAPITSAARQADAPLQSAPPAFSHASEAFDLAGPQIDSPSPVSTGPPPPPKPRRRRLAGVDNHRPARKRWRLLVALTIIVAAPLLFIGVLLNGTRLRTFSERIMAKVYGAVSTGEIVTVNSTGSNDSNRGVPEERDESQPPSKADSHSSPEQEKKAFRAPPEPAGTQPNAGSGMDEEQPQAIGESNTTDHLQRPSVDAPMPTHSGPESTERLDVQYRSFDVWHNEGYVLPSYSTNAADEPDNEPRDCSLSLLVPDSLEGIFSAERIGSSGLRVLQPGMMTNRPLARFLIEERNGKPVARFYWEAADQHSDYATLLQYCVIQVCTPQSTHLFVLHAADRGASSVSTGTSGNRSRRWIVNAGTYAGSHSQYVRRHVPKLRIGSIMLTFGESAYRFIGQDDGEVAYSRDLADALTSADLCADTQVAIAISDTGADGRTVLVLKYDSLSTIAEQIDRMCGSELSVLTQSSIALNGQIVRLTPVLEHNIALNVRLLTSDKWPSTFEKWCVSVDRYLRRWDEQKTKQMPAELRDALQQHADAVAAMPQRIEKLSRAAKLFSELEAGLKVSKVTGARLYYTVPNENGQAEIDVLRFGDVKGD